MKDWERVKFEDWERLKLKPGENFEATQKIGISKITSSLIKNTAGVRNIGNIKSRRREKNTSQRYE